MLLDLLCEVEGSIAATSTLQALVAERLIHFGLRVVGPVEDALSVTGRSTCTYSDAAFFGVPQAHNFKGRVEVTLERRGREVAHLGLAHEWGRLPRQATKAQVLEQYQRPLHLAVVLWLLDRPEVLEGVPPDRRAELDAWANEARARVLRSIGDMDCDVRALLAGDPSGAGARPVTGAGPGRR